MKLLSIFLAIFSSNLSEVSALHVTNRNNNNAGLGAAALGARLTAPQGPVAALGARLTAPQGPVATGWDVLGARAEGGFGARSLGARAGGLGARAGGCDSRSKGDCKDVSFDSFFGDSNSDLCQDITNSKLSNGMIVGRANSFNGSSYDLGRIYYRQLQNIVLEYINSMTANRRRTRRGGSSLKNTNSKFTVVNFGNYNTVSRPKATYAQVVSMFQKGMVMVDDNEMLDRLARSLEELQFYDAYLILEAVLGRRSHVEIISIAEFEDIIGDIEGEDISSANYYFCDGKLYRISMGHDTGAISRFTFVLGEAYFNCNILKMTTRREDFVLLENLIVYYSNIGSELTEEFVSIMSELMLSENLRDILLSKIIISYLASNFLAIVGCNKKYQADMYFVNILFKYVHSYLFNRKAGNSVAQIFSQAGVLINAFFGTTKY